MSRAKVSELRGLSVQELQTKEATLQKDLFDLRQKKITGQLDKPHQFKAVRRQIAQVHTLKREKQHADPKAKR